MALPPLSLPFATPLRNGSHLVYSNIGASVGLALAYYVLARIGLQFQLAGSHATPVWPPSGLALAAILLWGRRITPRIFLGALCANLADFYIKAGGSELVRPDGLFQYLLEHPEHVLISSAIGVGNTLEAVIGAWLIRTSNGNADTITTVRGVLVFGVCTLICCTISSTIAVSSLLAGAVLPAMMIEPAWFTWWLGDVTGILIVTPFVITWWSLRSAPIDYNSFFLAAVTLIVLFIFSQMIFIGWFDIAVLKRAVYLVFPILLVITFRFGAAAATVGILITSASAVLATLTGNGPFARSDETETLIVLEGFVGVASLTVLLLDATISERGRALRESMHALEQFRALFKGSPNGLIAVNNKGVIILVNARAAEMFGYQPAELVGRPVEVLVPEPHRAFHPNFRREFDGMPQARPMGPGRNLFAQRKDGSNFSVEIGLDPLTTSTGSLVLVTVVDITAKKRAEEKLSAALAERDELRRHLMRAQEQERSHLARELHDQTGQTLTAAMLELKRIETLVSGTARDSVRELRRQFEQIEATISRVAWELRPASIDELGLPSALSNYVSEWSEEFRIEADFHCRDTGLGQIGDELRTTIYRVAQEALTNVAKHAEGVTAVSVIIDRTDSVLRLRITVVALGPIRPPSVGLAPADMGSRGCERD